MITIRNNYHHIYVFYFRLYTPPLNYNGDICLEFSYHMYGDSVGELEVFMVSGSDSPSRFFSREGDQGDEWQDTSHQLDINRDDLVSYCLKI